MEDIELKLHPDTGKEVPEEWAEIKGYDGWYEVSNYGRVRSYYKRGPVGGRLINPRVLKLHPNGNGYRYAKLYINKSQKNTYIQILVARNFVPNPESKPEVNHLDGNKLNNFYLNLEWCTHKENIGHAIDSGLINQMGENCSTSKLKKAQVLKIRSLYKSGDNSLTKLAETFGVTPSQIRHIVNRKHWKHI